MIRDIIHEYTLRPDVREKIEDVLMKVEDFSYFFERNIGGVANNLRRRMWDDPKWHEDYPPNPTRRWWWQPMHPGDRLNNK